MTIGKVYREQYVPWCKEQWEIVVENYTSIRPHPSRPLSLLLIPIVVPFVYLYYFLVIPFQAFVQTLREVL